MMKDNKLIAEFMFEETMPIHQMKYHTDWNWLMPVLKKINLHLHPDTYGFWRMINVPTEYTIEKVHAQVVEFIKTYNK
jgi:hypothetical protein